MELHLSHLPHQRWHTIIIQNDLMQPVKLLFLKVRQHLPVRFTQHPAQGLADLALNPNGNVFLDEVLHHCEVILMCTSHLFEDALLQVDLCLLFFKVCLIEFIQSQFMG